MHYHIYCNQKSISQNHLLAIHEFTKRLSAYCEVTLHVNTDLLLPKDMNHKNQQFILIQSGTSTFSSEQFAEQLAKLQSNGKSTLHIIIGYDHTIFYNALTSMTDYTPPMHMSLSNNSLSCQTQTLLFYEQLYRAFTILQGKTYHK